MASGNYHRGTQGIGYQPSHSSGNSFQSYDQYYQRSQLSDPSNQYSSGQGYSESSGPRYPQSSGQRYPEQSGQRYTGSSGQRYTEPSGQRYPESSDQRYPQSSGQRYSEPSGQQDPGLSGQPKPELSRQRYPESSGQHYAQSSDQSYPQSSGQSYTHTSGQRYPKSSGQRYPQSSGQQYSESSGQRYPEPSRQHYSGSSRQPKPESSGQCYPESSVQSYPQSSGQSYPQSSGQRYAESSEQRYPDSSGQCPSSLTPPENSNDIEEEEYEGDEEELEESSPIEIKNYLSGIFGSEYKYYLGICEEEKETSEVGDDESSPDPVQPSPEFVEMYKDFPPTPDVMGKMLEGFVIYFGVREDSILEKDPLVVIKDSFLYSDRFGHLDVEDAATNFFNQQCILRWKGVVLAREIGGSAEEARYKAALSLINTLAHSCYTVQAKVSYYCGGKLPKFMLREPEMPGVYKIVDRDNLTTTVTSVLKELKECGYNTGKEVDVTHINIVLQFIEDFYSQHKKSHVELIFGYMQGMTYTLSELLQMFQYIKEKHPELTCRKVGLEPGQSWGRGKYCAVSRRVNPSQILQRVLQRGGDMQYRLMPPQGPGINLLQPDCQYSRNVVKLENCMDGRVKRSKQMALKKVTGSDKIKRRFNDRSYAARKKKTENEGLLKALKPVVKKFCQDNSSKIKKQGSAESGVVFQLLAQYRRKLGDNV